eukprot:TRINITY_DN56167_c0_g1_i1.p2 TRINITY_DN56167_c0_g1~~TRINITY_DN56167_c0_g1_i1.p2  ORF type:complete len:143 (-),score=23.37 TRINITY_DN56167_c0_g1_i1:468-896(-)
MAVSKEALIYSYILTFAVLLSVMTSVCQYFYVNRPKRRQSLEQWAPFVLQVIATSLLLISPLKNLLTNVCMQSFRQHGFDPTIEVVLDFAYKPMFGTRPMLVYTSIAYVLMFLSTAMQVDAWGKLQSLLQPYLRSQCTSPGG